MIDVITRFEETLDPAHPAARVIGYGEISTVFALDELDGVVVKRMAGFRTRDEIDAYRAVVDRYCALLAARGVDVAPTRTVPVGARAVYLVQPRLPAAAIGDAVLRDGSNDELRTFVRAVLQRITSVWHDNTAELDVGLDAQLSNWAWQHGRPTLIDVSTPLLLSNGRPHMDPALILRSMPRPIAWAFRRVALPSLLRRYHDAREVARDLAANFLKDGQGARLALALEEINAWLPSPDAPLTEREIRRAYASDARLWTAFQAVRRFDRGFTTKILRQRYEYILPGPVLR
jgi:hypothetical protein